MYGKISMKTLLYCFEIEISKRLRTNDSFAAHLLSVVYWLNEQPVHSLNEMQINTNKLKVQPVNFMERYSFIIKKPSNYHSYIQLAQLYIEIEKLYVKKMITKKSASR